MRISNFKGHKHTKEAKLKNRLKHLGKKHGRYPYWLVGKGYGFQKGIHTWNKGTKGMIKPNRTSFKKGQSPPHKGKKLGIIARMNMSRSHLLSNKGKGENHYNWKGGITPENRIIRGSNEYKEFRMKVLERDYWTCVKCGYKSKGGRDIRVDHIKPFHLYPELRLDVNNGRTLCRKCDYKFGYNYHRDKNKFQSVVTK